MRGKKYDCCNYCDARFPRRKPNDPETVPSRIEHLNKKHRDLIGEEVTIENYTQHLHYSSEE